MTFPILASLLVRLVVLLPFQLLRLSLATPSRWTPLVLSVFLHCVVALLLSVLPCWFDWSSYYHFIYSGYRWRLLRDGRRWRSPSFSIASWPCYLLYCRHFYFLCPSSSRLW